MSDALLVGATGMVGGAVIANADALRLTILARRETAERRLATDFQTS